MFAETKQPQASYANQQQLSSVQKSQAQPFAQKPNQSTVQQQAGQASSQSFWQLEPQGPGKASNQPTIGSSIRPQESVQQQSQVGSQQKPANSGKPFSSTAVQPNQGKPVTDLSVCPENQLEEEKDIEE